jgi:hypothetical protein
MAVGLRYFQFIPPELAHLPPEYISHSAEHHTVEQFQGREVVVLGAGASATNLAVLLNDAGASVSMISRRPELEIHTPMKLPRPWLDSVRSPLSPIGPSWRSRFFSDLPLLFHFLPEQKRLRIVRNYLGPAAGWFMRDRIVGQFPIVLGYRPKRAEVRPNGRLELEMVAADGTLRSFETDHVACGTGFKVDIGKMTVLTERLRASVRTVEDTPILSSHFESTVPGLYFAGPASANSFGPLLRFACGARFAAKRIVPHALRRGWQPAGAHPLELAPRLADQPSRSG